MLNADQVREQMETGLQPCETGADLLQTVLCFLGRNFPAEANRQTIPRLVDLELNHGVSRLYFFKISRKRSCGTASTR